MSPERRPQRDTADADEVGTTCSSDATEFDNEPQTEPPVPVSTRPAETIPNLDPRDSPRSEYRYPFEDEPETPEADKSRSAARKPEDRHSREITASRNGYHLFVPGGFRDEYDEAKTSKDHAYDSVPSSRRESLILPHAHAATISLTSQELGQVQEPILEEQTPNDFAYDSVPSSRRESAMSLHAHAVATHTTSPEFSPVQETMLEAQSPQNDLYHSVPPGRRESILSQHARPVAAPVTSPEFGQVHEPIPEAGQEAELEGELRIGLETTEEREAEPEGEAKEQLKPEPAVIPRRPQPTPFLSQTDLEEERFFANQHAIQANSRIPYRRHDTGLADTVVGNRESYSSELSEIDPLDQLRHASTESHQTHDTTPSLAVPSMHSAQNRLSQHSAWTDFSIDSNEAFDPARISAGSGNYLAGVQAKSPAITSKSKFDTVSRTDSAGHSVSHSPDPQAVNETQRRPESGAYRSHLPELSDTGDGFFIPYAMDTSTSSHVPIPDHEPPPVPTPGSGSLLDSRRTSETGTFYDQSNRGSAMIGSTDLDGFIPVMPPPPDQVLAYGPGHGHGLAIEDADLQAAKVSVVSDAKPAAELTEEERLEEAAVKKEKRRLAQRRLVIKELVDTEAVFVRDMNVVEEIYRGTAEACPELDPKTVKLVFRNTDEIINFHTTFLAQIKEAVACIYIPPQVRPPPATRHDSALSEATLDTTASISPLPDVDDSKDRAVSLGPVFSDNLEKMKIAHESFLRNSDQAAKRLIQIQQESTVKVWLNECNEVAKELTAAWDLDSLLIKPMQRITKYPNLILTILQHTPQDHPDRETLVAAKDTLETAIIEINKTKKNFELVGQIVGRKRKESEVKAGFARAFGKRVDKLQASGTRSAEDVDYLKMQEKFGDDYLRLQVVLRDVEFYTRQVTDYVNEFLKYLSSMELVMRLQPSPYPELESKWVQFNVGLRDVQKVALEQHVRAAGCHSQTRLC